MPYFFPGRFDPDLEHVSDVAIKVTDFGTNGKAVE